MITFLFVPKFWKRVLFILQKSSDFPGGRLGLPGCPRRKIHGASSFSRETYSNFERSREVNFWIFFSNSILTIIKHLKKRNNDHEGKEGWLYGTAGGSDDRS
jgi:hypothetical protein